MATRPSLEDILKDIPRQKLNQPCRNDHLGKIALSLTDWQSIAPFLGLLKVDIEEIEREHVKVRPQKLAMLWKWREKFGRKAKYQKLASVFWDLERTDLVEKLRELLQTESSSSSSDEDDSSAAKDNLPKYHWKRHEPEHRVRDGDFYGVGSTLPVEGTSSGATAVEVARQNSGIFQKWRNLFGRKKGTKPYQKDRGDTSATARRNTLDAYDLDTTAKAPQERTLDSYVGYGYLVVADREDLDSTAKATQECTLDLYAEYLRGRYSTEVPKFFTLQWPPPPTHKVFNLAIIRHQTIQRGPIDEELVRLTLRGNVDDIMRRKSSIELKNIFKLDGRRRKIILIEGAAGAGKSTLAWHVCQAWESGELFHEFKVVVFVQLRDPAVQSAISLFDILSAESESMSQDVLSELQSCKGRDVVFVLDGWDEYGVGLRADSPFQQLICRPSSVKMDFSSLIITSRPIASGELQQYATSRVEIVGFTSAEVKKYFSESIGDRETEQKLQDHLRERPVIEASCYLPLNAAIVVHLFLALNHTLPHTLHEVFVSLVLCCIIRHLTRQAEEGKEAPDISSLDDLPPELQEPFNNICAMAYHGVMENKATFSATDLRSFNLPTKLSTLSLIQGVQSFTVFKASISCNFLHLSVQELLGAFHISKLPAAEQIVIFNDLFDQPRLAAVFQFYAAFTKLQTPGIRDIVARIVQKKEKPLLVNLLHGLYEAQDPSLCQFVASHLEGELDLCENTLSPMDCLVVGYFLSCVCLTTSTEFIAKLVKCSLDEYRVSFLVKELSSSSLKPLLTLDLSKDNLSNGVVHITEILRHSNCFKTLYISECRLDDQGMKSLAGVLEISSSLRTLKVSNCGIDDQGMKSLASALEMNGSLEELDLSENITVTDIGLTALGESLKRNRGLKTLNISFCGIDDQGVKSLASALEMNSSLAVLDLSWNSAVTGIGLMSLGESLRKNRGLKTLMLYGLYGQRIISNSNWKQFIACLQENNDLTKLGLPLLNSPRELLRQETVTVNQIRREKNLPLLEVQCIVRDSNEFLSLALCHTVVV